MYAEGREAFTLTELLVVMLATAVLAALLLPALSQAGEQAKAARCMSNLRQCGQALLMYAGDYDGWLPPSRLNDGDMDYSGLRARWGTFLVEYGYLEAETEGASTLRGDNVLRCPAMEHDDHYERTYGMTRNFTGSPTGTPSTRFHFANLSELAEREWLWLADASHTRRPSMMNYEIGAGFHGPASSTSGTQINRIALVHAGNANVWFVSGRAESLAPDGLVEHTSEVFRYIDGDGLERDY